MSIQGFENRTTWSVTNAIYITLSMINNIKSLALLPIKKLAKYSITFVFS